MTVQGPPATGCATRRVTPKRTDTLVGGDWSLNYEISKDDGVVLSHVRLGARYMARRISLNRRAELTPSGDPSARFGRLTSFSATGESQQIRVAARYELLAPGGGCLEIYQDYRFKRERPGDQCAPKPPGSDPLPCSRFYPEVGYRFSGPAEDLTSVTMPQRLHMRTDNSDFNAAAWIQDLDAFDLIFDTVPTHRSPVRNRINPVESERWAPMVSKGRPGDWDNWHQTRKLAVDEPLLIPPRNGCPECAHVHWRWSPAAAVEGFNDANHGRPRIPSDSTQDVDVAIVSYADEEEDPSRWRLLLDGDDLGARRSDVRLNVLGRAQREPEPGRRGQPVMWYEGRSTRPEDAFFIHGGFFSKGEAGEPVVTAARMQPAQFTAARAQRNAGGPNGVYLSLRSSEIATATATIHRRRAKRPPDCREKSTRPKCARRITSLAVEVTEGATSMPFTAVVGRDRPLGRGRYLMRLRPADLTGRKGRARVLRFRVLSPRPAQAAWLCKLR